MKSVAAYITKFLITLTVILLLTFTPGCNQDKDREVTFQQLFSSPVKYNGKEITVEGFYFDGFEIQVIAESLDYSGYAEGHLVPDGEMIWVEAGIPVEVYDRLHRQQMMGPEERYGKVRVTGRFEYGGEYGHMGGYISQITPFRVELLEWSQPVP